ncbi:MAG: DNA-binding GntR family transcriptional regulator [Candidatus Azotimanducaceae bacterium]|jgi:DNA-binding GntR family transcriptional regulator
MFKPALNITEQIADFLSEKIVSGQMEGGARIQEVRLAKSLSVSRGSVREALLILERRHLITLLPRRGAHVNYLTKADAKEVVQLLALLEQRYLCANLGKKLSDCGDLDYILEKMSEAARCGDVSLALAARSEFYQRLLLQAPLYTRSLFETLLPSSQRVFFQLIRESDFDLFDLSRFYQALTVALRDRSAERVEELICAASRRATDLVDLHFVSTDQPQITADRSFDDVARTQINLVNT